MKLKYKIVDLLFNEDIGDLLYNYDKKDKKGFKNVFDFLYKRIKWKEKII